MQVIEIDVVGFEAAQRAFERRVNIFAAVAAGVGIAGLRVEGELRRDHHAVAQLPSRRIADQLLAVPFW